MPYYLIQSSYTPKAWEGFVNKPEDREATVRRIAEAGGCTVHAFFFAFGESDAVTLMEAPDQKTMMSTLIGIAASGAASVKTTVLVSAAEAKAAMEQAGKVRGSYRAPGAG